MRTLVIGDIHGGLKALIQVLEKAQITQDDRLIFLGDYVDGWSDSAQTIDYLIDLSRKYACIFIKGNHDFSCELWLRNGETTRNWLDHGGQMTIESYCDYPDESKNKHLNFLESLPYYHIDSKNRLFIHAGFTSSKGLEHEYYETSFYLDRTLWEMAIAIDESIDKDSIIYPNRLKLYSEIYVGHTATLNYNSMLPMNGANVWNLDTGAAFHGKLTVMDVDTKEYWQSDIVQSFYLGENGRIKESHRTMNPSHILMDKIIHRN